MGNIEMNVTVPDIETTFMAKCIHHNAKKNMNYNIDQYDIKNCYKKYEILIKELDDLKKNNKKNHN